MPPVLMAAVIETIDEYADRLAVDPESMHDWECSSPITIHTGAGEISINHNTMQLRGRIETLLPVEEY